MSESESFLLNVGEPAPYFSLPASDGTVVALDDFKGRTVILYFYPKDSTPGCTLEAQGFRTVHDELQRHGVVVLGVSADSVRRHEVFCQKQKLPFLLLSDEDHVVCQRYGVWVEKKMYGRAFWGVARSTFVIGPDGRLSNIYRKVKPATHPQEVFSALVGRTGE